ncbi:sugar transporter ERD6-like 5 isoform X1 [Prunus yedoensis var. nudiflora]|uniref:Sugar transporter ERD6-like 5 isoform X1 n=1 Tax=Prunus yedoensis var. nudiflora TaxID=2094558 RepID=A0A314YT30_PRUYE|nr:sugar transporter ERD6-like 5 isoform X1 [Prunus yedoensis var. nudiflora]
MGRESIEEGKLSNPLLVKNIDSESQVYGYGGRGENSGAGNEQQNETFSSSVTTMVVLSTLVAVSGSYVFGSAVGYSSPARSGVMDDLGLTVAEYSVFGSILTIGAMIGAVVSGRIADYIGRRGAMAFSEIFCILGWLAIAFSKVSWWAELGRLLVGCGMGLLSYVAKIDQEKKCEDALQNLRGKNADISQEKSEIRDYTETLKRLSEASILDLFQRRYAYSLIVGVGLMVLQQFGGVNGIAFYASTIFISAGFSDSIGTIAMVAVQIPMTGLGVILMDKSGRRPLLLVSSTGTCLGCLLVGLSFLLQKLQQWKQVTPILALVGVLVFTGSFSLGMGGIPWVIMSEIFPINMKGSAGSLVTLVSWLGSWIVSYAFNFLMDWNSAGTFFMFSCISGVTILFVAKLVPETKGRTLEEIQTSMNRFSEKR